MVKSCDSAWSRRALGDRELAATSAALVLLSSMAGSIMDMKVQGSRSGKALGARHRRATR